MIEEVRELQAYDAWATNRILTAAARLGRDDLTRDLGSSFPSVLDTLAHILSADWVWLERWLGRSPTGTPADWDLGTLDGVRARWLEVRAERAGFLEELTDQDLQRRVDYRDTSGRPWTSTMAQMLRHVVNHATYHRGQVVTMLRQLGATPPSTDLIRFYRERPGG